MGKGTLSVVIGRFQGLHNMHMGLLLEALEVSEHLVIILGSAYLPVSPRNPYSVGERAAVILDSLSDEGIDVERVIISPCVDVYDDNDWELSVTRLVDRLGFNYRDTTLVGHMKEDTQYLQEFGRWGYHEFTTSVAVSATIIRSYVRHDMLLSIKELVPAASYEFLSTHDHTYVHEFEEHVEQERKKLEDFPHAGHLNCPTSDALVTYQGKVLMIVRKNHPFKGMLALAGGHKQSNETFEQCARRELKEETLIEVKGYSHVRSHMFDKPNRDPVCCKPTVTFTYEFKNETPKVMMKGTYESGNFISGHQPKVVPSDDAIGYEWVSLTDLDDYRHKIAFDHFDIIRHFYPKGNY